MIKSNSKKMKDKITAIYVRISREDKLFERLYEDNVSGKVNDERYYKMSANYETNWT